MSYHVSRLGRFGLSIHTDQHGYVPQDSDGAWDLTFGHAEATHDKSGDLTEYGDWWECERWPEIVADAVRATAEAESELMS